MDENENLEYHSVDPTPVQKGTYVEDGMVYNEDGTPAAADNILHEKIERTKPFVNEFTRGAKIPRGMVTLDENGFEIDGSLNTDKSPMNPKNLNQITSIMGDDFAAAFATGRAINNNKSVKISKIVSNNNSN